MSLEADLVAFLKANAGVAAIVAARVYSRLPQSPTLPSLRYSRVSRFEETDIEGPSTDVSGRFQIDCFDVSSAAARTLADAVKAALHGHRGSMNGRPVKFVRLENETTLWEEDGDTVHHWISQDYLIYANDD